MQVIILEDKQFNFILHHLISGTPRAIHTYLNRLDKSYSDKNIIQNLAKVDLLI